MGIKLLFVFIILTIAGCVHALSGCAGAKIKYDDQNRVTEIHQLGIFPVKAKIGDNEIDSKMSLIDLNISGVKSGN